MARRINISTGQRYQIAALMLDEGCKQGVVWQRDKDGWPTAVLKVTSLMREWEVFRDVQAEKIRVWIGHSGMIVNTADQD